MDKVKELLAVACLAYDSGDAGFAVRAFLQGMDEARSTEDGFNQVVEFLRAPVAAINSDVPVSENTLAPALHSNQSCSSAMVDDGDEELEARAEAEDEIESDDEEESEEEESEDEEEEEEDDGMKLSISTSTPIRLKKQ